MAVASTVPAAGRTPVTITGSPLLRSDRRAGKRHGRQHEEAGPEAGRHWHLGGLAGKSPSFTLTVTFDPFRSTVMGRLSPGSWS